MALPMRFAAVLRRRCARLSRRPPRPANGKTTPGSTDSFAGDPDLRTEIRERAGCASRALGFADLASQANQMDVSTVVPFRWHQRFEEIVGAVCGCLGRDEPKSDCHAMDVGINRQRRLIAGEDLYARGRFHAHAGE